MRSFVSPTFTVKYFHNLTNQGVAARVDLGKDRYEQLRRDGAGIAPANSDAILEELTSPQQLPLLTEDETIAEEATAAEEPTTSAFLVLRHVLY